MNEILLEYILKVPEIHFGEPIGKLSRYGAWIDSSENIDGIYTVKFKMSAGNIAAYQRWLKTVKGYSCEVFQKS
ncbi:MAG: hypothetical protein ACI93R_002345 [Flavobacteriales bacterium]|jgi:hypothetical protein